MNPLEQTLQELAGKVVANNLWRQRRCFNLIPSENTPSLLVKLCEIADPSGRYAEHKTALKKEIEALTGSGALKGDQVYYYQATDFIFEVEERLKQEFGRYIGATEVEARPISGQMANEITFKACVKFFGSGAGGLPAADRQGAHGHRHEQQPELRRAPQRPAVRRPVQLRRRRAWSTSRSCRTIPTRSMSTTCWIWSSSTGRRSSCSARACSCTPSRSGSCGSWWTPSTATAR